MYAFRLPDIGEGISEAKLIGWSVSVGDSVEDGTEIATVSTDKVDVELPSPCAGTVTDLPWQPGETIPVGAVLARIDDGRDAAAETKPADRVAVSTSAGGAVAASRTAPAPATSAPAQFVAAPSVRRFARTQGVDLKTLRGTGPEGRVLQRDVEAAVAACGRPAPAAMAEAPGTAAPARREPLSPARAVAAERLAHSVHTLAHSTISFEVPADALRDLLDKLGPEAARREVKLTPVSLIAKCITAALPAHPRFNATIDEANGELLLHDDVHMGIAVAAPSGLIVPVVRGAGHRSLFDIARAVADLAERARGGGLGVADVQGGTFTLSSTGSLERATLLSTRPIVNPPQTAILWASRINERPRVIDGVLGAGPMLSCSLSFDHRFIDGADSTYFINDLAEMFECPERALA